MPLNIKQAEALTQPHAFQRAHFGVELYAPHAPPAPPRAACDLTHTGLVCGQWPALTSTLQSWQKYVATKRRIREGAVKLFGTHAVAKNVGLDESEARNAEGLVTSAFYHRHLVPRALQVWRRHVRTSRRLTQTQGLIRLQWKRMAMRDHLECWIEFCNHPADESEDGDPIDVEGAQQP